MYSKTLISTLQKLSIFLTYLFCLLLLFLISQYHTSYDMFWHLKTGMDWINQGLSPWVDHYSFTFNGEPIAAGNYYVFQIILASLVKLADNNVALGFAYYKMLCFTLIFILIYFYFKQLKTPWFIQILSLLLLTIILQFRALARPELLDYVLFICSFLLLIPLKQKWTNKYLFFTSLFILIWTNYHTAIFGYMVFFALFVDKALQKLTQPNKKPYFSWRSWIFWGSVLFFVGFLNPDLQHQLFSGLNFSSTKWEQYILEHRPTSIIYPNNILLNIIAILSLYTIFGLIILKQYGSAFVGILFFLLFWKYARFIAPSSLYLLLMFSYVSSKVNIISIYQHLQCYLRFSLVFIWSAICIYAFYYSINMNITWSNFWSYKISKGFIQVLPFNTIKYLTAHNTNTPVNILNHFRLGGFLINYLPANFKIYIDGRTNILYPFSFLETYMHISTPDGAAEELNKYNIHYILFPFKKEIFNVLTYAIPQRYYISFIDNNYMLYSQNQQEDHFTTTTELYFYPMCWNNHINKKLLHNEIQQGKRLLSKTTPISPLLKLLKDYLQQADVTQEFYSRLSLTTAASVRLAAYMAYQQKYYLSSIQLLDKIIVKSKADSIFISIVLTHLEKYALSESYLQPMIPPSDPSSSRIAYKLNNNEKWIIWTLLTQIQQHKKLDVSSQQFLQQLQKEAQQLHPRKKTSPLIQYGVDCSLLRFNQ